MGSSLFIKSAAAEKVLLKTDEWEVFTDGRAGAFLSYVRGDGLPRAAVDSMGNQVHDIWGGGLDAAASRDPIGTTGQVTQGTIEGMRVRSGFVANTLGFGVRGSLDEDTTITGYIQIWAYVESTSEQKSLPVYPDVRQGYAKVEGLWGSVLAGRSRGLFSRGATDIDALYAHRYGVGYPGSIDNYGPTLGHIGFGVLGSGFSAGLVYATPVLGGLQISVGAYDPVQIPAGTWSRTKWPRAESEITFERPLADIGKFVLFANGGWEELYQNGQPDDVNAIARGFGYGGRLELGPVHLGVAGHYGSGLGLGYALESSLANSDPANQFRKFDGYYAQSQVVLGRFDVSLGMGISRVFLNSQESEGYVNGQPTHSVIKYQLGNSAGIVFHVKPYLHLDLDAFRADFKWYLGEEQVVYIVNSGMTFTW